MQPIFRQTVLMWVKHRDGPLSRFSRVSLGWRRGSATTIGDDSDRAEVKTSLLIRRPSWLITNMLS